MNSFSLLFCTCLCETRNERNHYSIFFYFLFLFLSEIILNFVSKEKLLIFVAICIIRDLWWRRVEISW